MFNFQIEFNRVKPTNQPTYQFNSLRIDEERRESLGGGEESLSLPYLLLFVFLG
jgi:hypothetical protein